MMQLELACGDSSDSVPAEPPRVPAVCNPIETLWASTDLKSWCPPVPALIARDCQINDRCYRRLDPEYFAWLKIRMHGVRAAADTGRVPAEAFEELRRRFNEVQARAIEMFGAGALLEAVRSLDVELYRPPLPDEFWRVQSVTAPPERCTAESERLARARGLVDEIRDQALALGWAMESLYASEGYNRRPSAAGYGLVCYIGAAERIGEVTRQSIELIGPAPMETRSRVYNRDVNQPWIRSIAPASH